MIAFTLLTWFFGSLTATAMPVPFQDSASTEGAATEAPWQDLFDGDSLRGWTPVGGPYDGKALWSVEDGAIVGRQGPEQAGGLLYTEGQYADFELEVEAYVTYPFDSGIFLRMRPGAKGAQVTLDHRPGGEIGAIYSDGYWLHHRDGSQGFVSEGWNRFRVRCVGEPMHVQVWMNDELLTDYRFPAEAEGFAATGRIGLQVHGSRDDPEDAHVRFRGLRIRPLAAGTGDYFEAAEAGATRLTDAGRSAGWTALFDGTGLEHWESAGAASGYAVRDGELAFLTEGAAPYLRTKEDYTDFHLRLDFKIGRTANSGLFLRGERDGGDPAYSGCEIQILDDFHFEEDTGYELKPWQFTGSLYGAVAPAAPALRPLGEWNTYDLVFRGNQIAVALNGKVLYDVDTQALEVDPPFADRVRSGFIGLQRHAPDAVRGDAYAWFRNIYLREL